MPLSQPWNPNIRPPSDADMLRADLNRRMAENEAKLRAKLSEGARKIVESKPVKQTKEVIQKVVRPVQRGVQMAGAVGGVAGDQLIRKGLATKDTTLITIIFLALMFFHLIDAGFGFSNLSLRIFVYLMGASVVLFFFHFKDKNWPLIATKFSEDMGPEYRVGWLKLHFGRIAGLFLTVVFYSLVYRYVPDIQRMFLPLGALGNMMYIIVVLAFVLTILYFVFSKEAWDALFKSVMLGFLATFIPVYLPYFSNLGVDNAIINIVLLFFPVYYVYFVFVDPPENKFFKWLRNFTIFIWLFIFLTSAYAAIEAGTLSYIPNLHAIPGVEAAMQPSAWGAFTDFWRLVTNAFGDFWDATIGIFANIGKSWNQYLIYASGGYYQGTVEQNQNTPLGVYIDQLKSTNPKFYEKETVSVYAMLHGKTLALEKGKKLEIKMNCENDKDKSRISELSRETITIYGSGEEVVDCMFPGGFDAGAVKITLSASFDFTTMGYLKTYFIDKQKYEDFQKSGIDVFKHYGLEENPSAIYTNGPIMLGIRTRSPPIAIKEDSSENILVGITIENQWSGTVDEIKEITVEIPEGLKINKDCEYLREGETKEGYVQYNLVKFPSASLSDIFSNKLSVETFRSIWCYAKITDDGVDKLLGTTPVSTKYIRATVKYSYTVKKDITVDVEKQPGTT